MRKLTAVLAIALLLVCGHGLRAHGAMHTLSEFKKLYTTFYVLPYDMRYLKERPPSFFLDGDIGSYFNDNLDNKYLFETFRRLQEHLMNRGFILVDSPEKADAILAFRVQLAGYDVYHECARNASIRLIDPVTHDTIMLLYTPGMSFLTLKRDLYDELNELFKVMDANMDTPVSARKFAKKLYKAKKACYKTIEKDGLMVSVANLYDTRLSRQAFGLSIKCFDVAPVRIILKNNTGEDVVFRYLDSRLSARTNARQSALTSYDVMKIIGKYDKIFECLIDSVLFGPIIGFGDAEGWAPENDEREFGVVYNKFDPVVRLKPGEEVSGVLLFDLAPPEEKRVARTQPIPLRDATLTLSVQKASGGAIQVQTQIR